MTERPESDGRIDAPPRARLGAASLFDLDRPVSEVARRVVAIAAVCVGVAILFILVWRSANALWVMFGGLLFAVFLDAAAEALGKVLPLGRRVRIVIIALLFFALVAAGLFWGGATLYGQARALLGTIGTHYQGFVGELEAQGLGQIGSGMIPNLGAMMGNAARGFGAAADALTTFFIILFLGAFFAWAPAWYKAPLLSLLPKDRRPRLNAVLDHTGAMLRWWLIGQSVSMATVFAVSLVVLWAIGMPYAFLLALQAGLLAFIPTLGPALAGVVIVVVGFTGGAQMALWGFLAYLLIQAVESNITEPIVQRKTVSLPPSFAIGAQLVAAALFGIIGAALAVPALAALSVLVRELYVEDGLGGGVSVATVEAWSAGDSAKRRDGSGALAER